MIDRTHSLPITRQAELVGISRGNVYYLPRAASEADQRLMKRIDVLHLAHPFVSVCRSHLDGKRLLLGSDQLSSLASSDAAAARGSCGSGGSAAARARP